MSRYGVRTFARHLGITKPARVVADTKRWAKFWTVDHEPLWTNFATLVPDPTKLVLLASSIDGDVVGYTGRRYVILPRHDEVAVGLADLASVFGWFVATLGADGARVPLTYG